MRNVLASTLIVVSVLTVAGSSVWSAGKTEDSTAKVLGDYVPLRVDNFEKHQFVGTTKAEYCVSEAWKEIDNYKRAGASVEALIQSQFYSFYKVITANDQRIAVICNQNGSLIIGWKPDSDVENFVNATTVIGISLKEKEIDNNTPPPVVINNNSR